MSQLIMFLIGTLFGRYIIEVLDLYSTHISNLFTLKATKIQVKLNALNAEKQDKAKYKIGFQPPDQIDECDPIIIDDDYIDDDYDDDF